MSDKPVEGRWYSHRSAEAFFVIGVYESDGVVDVRDEHGDVDEFDLDEWDAMDLRLCATPEEWAGVRGGLGNLPTPEEESSWAIFRPRTP